MHSVRSNYTKASLRESDRRPRHLCHFRQADARAEPWQARRDLCPLIRVGCDPMAQLRDDR